MASVCKTWSMPSANIVGLCSSMYDPPPGQNTCPVCVMPVSLIGPVGCCGCPSTEQFPAIWTFDSGFSIGGGYADPEVTTDDSLACLSNVNPAGSAAALATTTRYRIDLSSMTGMPLIRGTGVGGTPSCAWGNGDGYFNGYSYYPTYGTPSPPVGGCSLTPGYTEIRCTYPFSGPYAGPSGSTTVGSIASGACIWPPSAFNWTGVTDTPYEGDTLAAKLWSDAAPCGAYPSNVIVRELLVKSVCWGWFLRCVVDGGLQYLTLSLTTSGYAHVTLDRPIWLSDGFTTKWVHDELGFGSLCLSPAITGVTHGVMSWSAVYPCGNPATMTLTRSSAPPTGMFTGLSFPSTITLRAVY